MCCAGGRHDDIVVEHYICTEICSANRLHNLCIAHDICKTKCAALELGTMRFRSCIIYAMRFMPALYMQYEMSCAGDRHDDIFVEHYICNELCSCI